MKHITNKGDWPSNAIIYQIYPRSFQDSNGDGVGDLNGIISRLDYLNDGTKNSLGINTIWLSPIYPSPMVDFGYDVSDYKDIDPVFGTLDDFERLLTECHKRGIKVLMDFIPNHTSSKHEWFLQSRLSKKNDKRDFYIWKDPKPGQLPPNNWLSVFGGSAWEYDPQTKQYYMHSFHKEQPDLNWRNPEVMKEMLDVLRFWLDRGVDGFRVDVPEWMIKDERFLDEPENPLFPDDSSEDPYHRLMHTYTLAQSEYVDVVKKFVDVLEEYGQKFIVTEVWSSSEQLIKVYNRIEKHFFAPFNFFMITAPWDAAVHKEGIDKYDDGVTSMYTPTYVLGSHDKSRIASRIPASQIRIAAMLLFTLRGIPFIYYGEELGMEDTPIPQDQIHDPFEKNSPGLGLGRDPERTPMQWNKKPKAGFTTGKPWLPINENYKKLNAQTENIDPKSLLSFYKQLIHIRNESKALLHGKYASWDTGSDKIFAYTRHKGSEVILVILNYSDLEQRISLPFRKGKVILDSKLRLSVGTDVLLHDFTVPSNNGFLINV